MDTPSCDSLKNFPSPVILPATAESILNLAVAVIERHQSEGVRSPLKNHLIADLHYKTSLAKSKHNEGMKYFKLMEEAFVERNILVGLNSANGSQGTTITDILSALALVLIEHDTEQLVNWGFTVE
jgi:uncharacterized protein (UPF0261 family)